MNYRLFFLFLVVLSLTSCRSKKKVLYFKNSSGVVGNVEDYQLKIHTDDLLYINVMSIDQEAVEVFNGTTGSSTQTGAVNPLTKGYLVDSDGYINYPVLGKFKVGGLCKSDVVKLLEEKLSTYVKDPVVKLRFMNFKVTVIGEVQGGVQNVSFDTEKATLPQLFAQVGDLSLLSSRKNVVVVREVNGVKTFNRIDMTQADIVNSPFYYLAQNDVVYVEPTQNKVDTKAVPPSLLNIASLLTMVVSVFFLVKSIK